MASIAVLNHAFSNINPVQFGYEECEKSHHYGPAMRTHWLLHYVAAGNGIFQTGGKTYYVNAGDLFVIPPFVETYYEADSKTPWSYIWIGFTTDGKLPVRLDDVIHRPEAAAIFEKMKECHTFENGRSAFLCAKIWELFSLLLESRPNKTDYVQMALSCMHSEFMHGITVQDIADRLNLNRSYFSILFKKKTGVSPAQYLIRYRMEFAASLMVNRGKSVSVAAYSSGYADLFAFSKMFKQYYGVSPRKYIEENVGHSERKE